MIGSRGEKERFGIRTCPKANSVQCWFEAALYQKMTLLHPTTRAAWRAWLAENHDRVTEIWRVYSKRHTGQPRVEYDDAVEEALCFGWIDSIVRPLDEEKYMQKFTPRKTKTVWCALNKK